MEYKIDLHVHSSMSDGTYSPKEIVGLALESQVRAIALTDHDSVEGVNEASEEALSKNINFLTGIEISASYKYGRILHILGLGIDINNENFLKSYTNMKKAREDSVKDILKKIEKQGVFIDIDTLRERALNKYLDRYDIHRYFMENAICSNAQDVWDRYLDPIPYGEDELIKVSDAIEIINKANGLSFLAHYNKKIGLGGFNNQEIEQHIKYLIDLGLNGVEKYYPSYKKENNEFLQYLINKYQLIPSGGTDFHGENRPDISIGKGNGDMIIPYTIYENILKRLNFK